MLFQTLCSSLLLSGSFVSFSADALEAKQYLTRNQPSLNFNANAGTIYTICSSEKKDFSIASIFDQMTITVQMPSDHKLPFHSVKGVSTDDFHNNLESLMYHMFGTEEEKSKESSPVVKFPQSFVRDIVSACPSPVFHDQRSKCPMSFSPFGEGCIQIKTDSSAKVTAFSEMNFNVWLPVNMIIGLLLIRLSFYLAKSSFFQYSSGAVLFITGGALVMSLVISRRVILGGKHPGGRQSELTGISSLLVGSYGATTVWFLRSYLRTICFKYAEFALGYVGIMAALGIVFIYTIRNIASAKDLLRLTVKWLLRFIGIVFVWRSTASPMLSLAAISVLFVLYVVHAMFTKLTGRGEEASKGKKQKKMN